VHGIWTTKKGDDIDMNKRKDTIPDHFNNAEEAGEFWDTQMEFDIQKRTVLVPLDDRIYQCASEQAKAKHSTVTQIINTILNRELLETE
jgi:hypothetical protein